MLLIRTTTCTVVDRVKAAWRRTGWREDQRRDWDHQSQHPRVPCVTTTTHRHKMQLNTSCYSGVALPTTATVSVPIYRVFQKKWPPPLKLFGIFSLRLNLFTWNFANLLAVHIHITTTFCRFILIFHQMALIFPRVPIVFTLSSFE